MNHTTNTLETIIKKGGKIHSPDRKASLFYENGKFVVDTSVGDIDTDGSFEDAVKALDMYCFED